jgi:hypothetical protein
MTVTNPPLAPWQIEHIRKMQEELGLPQSAPDTEEVTMDEELNGQPSAGTGDVAGGLSVYGDAEVKAAMAEEKKLAGEREAYYDKIAKALEEKRYGPSFSERMFQLSAAFAAPTSTRGFSGVMGNIMPVLAAQQKAKREGEISRREALEQLEANRLTNRLGLAKQDTQTKIALAKLGKQAPVRGVAVGDTLRNPFTNEVIGAEYNRVPMPDYYKALEAAPTPENLQAAVAYYPTFAVQLKAAYDRGLKNKGR